ncbi:hypothetical protein VYU27_010643, partial [Nannochloropsis oceanica]
VAMGIALHRIPDIRRLYGLDPLGSSPIDFDTAERVPPTNHCIAVRVTAENPDMGFKPTSGTIQELNFRSTPDVWGYFSVDSSELSIRGDIRTTVEYISVLMATEDFVKNPYRRTTQRATAFVELLGKGQFPSDRDFLIEQSVDLIYEDVKYQ